MGIIFVLLMKFITAIANFFLAPINAIVVNLFPDFTDMINHFESLVNTYITPGLSWFFHILPPHTQSIILFYIDLLILLYTAVLSIHVVLKVIHILKNVKVW